MNWRSTLWTKMWITCGIRLYFCVKAGEGTVDKCLTEAAKWALSRENVLPPGVEEEKEQ